MSDSCAPCRIGIDIGGTFTDVVCVREGHPAVVFKIASTPADPGEAAIAAVRRVVESVGVEPAAITQVAHGTTVATNAVLEKKGGRLGIVTTEGFRDTLEIGRQMRREMYEVRLDPQTPVFLAPRAMRRGVRERVGARGEVIEPLDEDMTCEALDRLVSAGAECIAVCLLFSFLNPKHERRIRDIALTRHPGLEVSLSCEVDPTFREYERTAVTAFDAYIKPVVHRYLTAFSRRLAAAGVRSPLQVMQSRGGLAGAGTARQRPVRLFLSGPAAGVIGAQAVGALAGDRDLISVDVGGTSSDIALISGAKPLLRAEGIIAGYPVRVPMVDVNTIGAGGGSIAWLDGAGGLRVGPRSAASDPGPACYARGGLEPTLTDASLVLGFLDPARFAGGAIGLDPERSRESIRLRIAEPLGLCVEEAAAGIHRVVNAQMAEGIRLVSVAQGYDPRAFSLLAMGGAGPIHACALASELGIGRIIIPRHPGVLSAAGLLAAPIEHEAATAFAAPFAGLGMADLRRVAKGLDAMAAALMEREGVPAAEVEVHHYADVCHIGQGYHLEVPLHLDAADGLERLYEDFLAAHERIHGHAVAAPARFVNIRSVHRQRMSGPVDPGAIGSASAASASARNAPGIETTGRTPGEGRSSEASPDAASPTRTGGGRRRGDAGSPRSGEHGTRMVRFSDAPERLSTRILARSELVPGEGVEGPAIVEQDDTTTLIPPGWTAIADDEGTMILAPAPPEACRRPLSASRNAEMRKEQR